MFLNFSTAAIPQSAIAFFRLSATNDNYAYIISTILLKLGCRFYVRPSLLYKLQKGVSGSSGWQADLTQSMEAPMLLLNGATRAPKWPYRRGCGQTLKIQFTSQDPIREVRLILAALRNNNNSGLDDRELRIRQKGKNVSEVGLLAAEGTKTMYSRAAA